jgi:asparagine synthase (glutamine-hydrolysing)
MCGIAGIVQIGGRPRRVVDEETLAAATDAMAHRGPDDRGTHVEPGIALGIRRLSVMDPELGSQPMSSEDGVVWAIQNGELYNHRILREELRRRGHTLLTDCDTEVLPHLYETYGDELTGQLNGMFAFAIWDSRRRRALIARDHVGVKPLYWTQRGDLLIFASELKSLLEFGVPPSIDEEAIDAYLALGFIPGPRTPFAGVQKLEPGHRIVVENGGFRIEQWWEFPLPAPDGSREPTELRDELRRLLESSVELQLEADVPVGAMLSGGLDSSMIVALAARRTRHPLQTFAVGFEHDNELGDARRVAAQFGTKHHELLLQGDDGDAIIGELAWHLDEPLADLSAVGFYALSELAARHVTVALSGQGADELFGGYRKHVAAAFAGRVPRALASAAAPLQRFAPKPLRRPFETIVARTPAERLMIASALRGDVFGRGERPYRAALGAAVRAAGGLDAGALPAALYLDAKLGLVDDMLHYFDRASMAHSLEVRVPFLDHRIVEFSSRLPDALRVHGRTTKVLLREVARDLVPDYVIAKKKVGFFNKRIDPWLATQGETLVGAALTAEAPLYGDFVDAPRIRRAFADHLSGRDSSNGRALFTVAMLELWLDAFVSKRRTTETPLSAAVLI